MFENPNANNGLTWQIPATVWRDEARKLEAKGEWKLKAHFVIQCICIYFIWLKIEIKARMMFDRFSTMEKQMCTEANKRS